MILAEIGLDMSQFPTAGTWCPGPNSPPAPSSPGQEPPGKTGKGNPYLKGVLGDAAAAAARTDTFLGERYRRLVKRRGKLKALVAVARSILVIIWHLLADPAARYHDLGADYYTTRIDKTARSATTSANSSPRLPRHPPTHRPGLTHIHSPTTQPRPRKLRRLLSPAPLTSGISRSGVLS